MSFCKANKLADQKNKNRPIYWQGLASIKQGCLYSMFGVWTLPDDAEQLAEASSAHLYRDEMMADRMGILFAESPALAQSIESALKRIIKSTDIFNNSDDITQQ